MLTLAALALFVRVLIPAGFMADAPPAEGLPFQIVICTALGAVPAEPGDHAPAGTPAHDAPCAFAGHGQGLAAADLAGPAPAAFVTYPAPPAADHADLAPGRGLAAPPPPGRAPPTLNA